MTVRSYDMPNNPPPPKPDPAKPAAPARPATTPPPAGGLALFVGRLGMWLAVISFGGIFWSINGGFSVIGLGVFASSFNDSGRLFWAAASAITFHVPVAVPGLPATQPLIPWIGVVASSCLQISVAWLKLSGRAVPLWLWAFATAASFYDYGTTYFGLSTVAALARLGSWVQAAVAAPLTFGLEAAVAYALRGGKR